MSTGIQIKIAVQLYKQPILDSTGYLLRERRKALGITSRELAKRLGVDRTLVLRAELNNTILDMFMLIKICNELDIDPLSVIDGEYKFIHEGYKQAIGFLMDKLGIHFLLDELKLKDVATIKRWRTGKTTPTVEQKRSLLILYNMHNHG
jgi:DNA-binding XRE family transcriptional regulator